MIYLGDDKIFKTFKDLKIKEVQINIWTSFIFARFIVAKFKAARFRIAKFKAARFRIAKFKAARFKIAKFKAAI
jgi:uncharacterized protein YjbI with pentapeptide repeats